MLASEAKTKRRLELAIALALLFGGGRNQDELEVSVFRAVIGGRLSAASAGVSAARRELTRATTKATQEARTALQLSASVAHGPVSAVDIRRAERAARGYSKAIRAETAEGATVRQATQLKRWAVDRIAATESAEAFNAAKTAEVERLARVAGVALVRTWDATLDKLTCDDCAGLDGKSVRVGESFPGGAEPGSMHPHCRCTETISTLH